jgi:hypothetical protein
MTKTTKIKNYLIEKCGIQEYHFDVDIEGISRGSLEYKRSITDIRQVNKYFETRIHSVKSSENWYSVTFIGKGIADYLIVELNNLLEKEGEEIIKLENNQYSTLNNNIIDVYVKSKGDDIEISLTWRINGKN